MLQDLTLLSSQVHTLLILNLTLSHYTRHLPQVYTNVQNMEAPQKSSIKNYLQSPWRSLVPKGLFPHLSILDQRITLTSFSHHSRMSADILFPPDTLTLASYVYSIHLFVETITGTEHGLSRFLCIKILCFRLV